jgi:hypothetical protein
MEDLNRKIKTRRSDEVRRASCACVVTPAPGVPLAPGQGPLVP